MTSIEQEYLTRDAVDAEFRQTIKGFELDLPPGFSFPRSDLALGSANEGHVWEQGSGSIDVYFWWEAAMISAAASAYLAGRIREARRYVEVLIEGTKTELYRSHVLDEPGYGWVDFVGYPALEHDHWEPLLQQATEGVQCEGFADMAKDAGHIVRRN